MLKKILLFFITLISIHIIAQNPTLDTTFGALNYGYTEYISNLPAPDYLNAAAKTLDGKTVFTGYSDVGERRHLIVAKVNDTDYETGFGYSGLTLPLNESYWVYNSEGKDIAVQPDGKIIIVGFSQFYEGINLVIIRLNSDGSRDESFNNNGIVKMRVNNNSSYANAVSLQTDGKIIVGGYFKNGSTSQAIILRINPNGILDTTFGNQGITTITTGNNNDIIKDVAIQSDGKIVACGENALYGSKDFMTLRLNTDGSLDTTFNTTGIVFTGFGTNEDTASCLTMQSDGKILVGGYGQTTISTNTSINYCIARYNTNGTLDTTFSSDGKTSLGYPNVSDMMNTILVSSGRIYLGGTSYVNTTNKNDFCIVALTDSGSLDTSYNGGQGVYRHNSGFDDYGTCLVSQATHNYLFGISNNKFSYFKLLTTNSNLYENLNFLSNNSHSLRKLNTDYYCYNRSGDFDTNIGALNFTQNGIINTNFGNQGISLFFNENNSATEPVLNITTDNKIILAGHEKVYKLNLDGTLDNNFANSGILNIPIGSDGFFLEDVVCSPDNTFYVIGHEQNIQPSNYLIFKFNATGTLVTTYGNSGKSTIPVNDYSYPFKALLQSDGKLVIVGVSGSFSTVLENLTLARINTDGSLDTTFGTNGISIQNIQGMTPYPYSVKLQNDGKIIAAFSYKPNPSIYNEFTLVRYNQNGILDTTFGNNGIAHTSIGDTDAYASDITILNDNKILAVGSNDQSTWKHLTLVLHNPDGTLDTSFGTNGIFMESPDGISDYKGVNIHLEPDGKITVLSTNYNGVNTNTTLLRYVLDTNLGTVDFGNTDGLTYVYPNPIEKETTLLYNLKTTSLITLELFDLQGKLIKTFISNENRIIGDHSEKLEMPENLQSGSYLLKITSPEGTITLRIIKK